MKKVRTRDSINGEHFQTLYHSYMKAGMDERKAYFAAKRAVKMKDAEPLHHLFEQIKNRVAVCAGAGEEE